MNAAEPQFNRVDRPDAFVPSEAGYRRALEILAPTENRRAGLCARPPKNGPTIPRRPPGKHHAPTLAYIRANPGATNAEIGEQLGATRKVIAQVTCALVTKGQIVALPREGSWVPKRFEAVEAGQ